VPTPASLLGWGSIFTGACFQHMSACHVGCELLALRKAKSQIEGPQAQPTDPRGSANRRIVIGRQLPGLNASLDFHGTSFQRTVVLWLLDSLPALILVLTFIGTSFQRTVGLWLLASFPALILVLTFIFPPLTAFAGGVVPRGCHPPPLSMNIGNGRKKTTGERHFEGGPGGVTRLPARIRTSPRPGCAAHGRGLPIPPCVNRVNDASPETATQNPSLRHIVVALQSRLVRGVSVSASSRALRVSG